MTLDDYKKKYVINDKEIKKKVYMPNLIKINIKIKKKL